jgi:hypothetical protein
VTVASMRETARQGEERERERERQGGQHVREREVGGTSTIGRALGGIGLQKTLGMTW